MPQEIEVAPSAASLAGWEDSGAEVDGREAGALAVVAREDTELKAAIVSAKRFPRDEAAAYTRIMKACDRPSLAERAAYSFPRGGNKVSGPSVYLAREASRCWGNIRTGLRIVSVDDEQVHIRGYALDLETNAYAETEDRFAKKIQRKRNGRTVWVDPDERDLRELVNRRGAICARNAILQIIPADVVEDALRQAGKTMAKAAAGELSQNREDAVRRIVMAFDSFGVNGDMLREHIGHELSALTPDELAELRQIYVSLNDGHTKVADHFPLEDRRSGGASELNERLRREEPEEDGVEDIVITTKKDRLEALRKFFRNEPREGPGTATPEQIDDIRRMAVELFEDGTNERAAMLAWADQEWLGIRQANKLIQLAQIAAESEPDV